ncbi:MAG: hypothetical protein methR_P2407 [Methyloprofundus sp.]|nr:MAG: hypothetical protein methR_P2407 [Methyloprofundus sp.]
MTSFFSHLKETVGLAKSQLQGHDDASKQHALDAVDILVQYKATVHEFTDEIVAFWPLPRRVMERYHFDDADQLNEWLDNIS